MARLGLVTLTSETPKLSVSGILIRPAPQVFPAPRYDQLQRYGFYDLPKYAGQEPFQLVLPLKFEDAGRSVAGRVRTLERMMERVEGRDAPPEVTVKGPVSHSTLTWRVARLDEDTDRTEHNADGEPTFIVITVTLLQRVTDTALSASLRPSKRAKGIGSTTKVRQGETDLYDVAQRYYRDSAMAIAIAKANPVKGKPMPLGTRLKPGQMLRMP